MPRYTIRKDGKMHLAIGETWLELGVIIVLSALGGFIIHMFVAKAQFDEVSATTTAPTTITQERR